MPGMLTIYVEREKKKVKAVADYGEAQHEFDIDEVYVNDPGLEEIVDWAYSTDLSKSLKEYKRKIRKLSYIFLNTSTIFILNIITS
jgi:hypothetical protein